MNDDELLELGIIKTLAPGRGTKTTNAYIYKCASCGRSVQKLVLILDRPIYCNLCKKNAYKKLETAKKRAEKREIELNSIDENDADKKIQFRKAVDIICKHKGYEVGINKAKDAYNKYESISEAVAAIILLNLGYKVIAQQPLAGYRLDFVLPDRKVVIEIDGSIYHTDVKKREIRDTIIKYNLGSDWDIIHVPAESLKAKPKVFEKLIKIRLN